MGNPAYEEHAKQAVQRGAKLLDTKLPGWYSRIDTEELDIDNIDTCILGQLYPSYFEGIQKLSDAKLIHSPSYGFDSVEYPERERMQVLLPDALYMLKNAWIEEINARL